jgi:hypothetical protein
MNNQILYAIKNLEQRVVDLYSKIKNINISSAGDLQAVTTQGSTTTNNVEFNDGAKILFDNGSRLQKGTTNSETGGNGGIAQVCSIDYELKWEAGRQYVMQQDGFTIREVSHNFTLTPGVNDDITRGFVSSSRWILDNGDIYVCTDNTEENAVWELQVPVDSRPYKVYTALLKRTGASVEPPIVLENTLGTITLSYDGIGIYNIDSSGLFTADKTAVFVQVQPTGSFGVVLAASRISSTRVSLIQTTDSGASENDWVYPVSIEIRVYN